MQIFVAVMGASNFAYLEATWTKGLADLGSSAGEALDPGGNVLEGIVTAERHRSNPKYDGTKIFFCSVASHYQSKWFSTL
jgi:hypothetical protein